MIIVLFPNVLRQTVPDSRGGNFENPVSKYLLALRSSSNLSPSDLRLYVIVLLDPLGTHK